MSTDDPILIIGGGLGGLTLGHLLHQKNIPFHIYERDEHPNARVQGYAIGINTDGYSILHGLKNQHVDEVLDQHVIDGFVMFDEMLNVLVRFKDRTRLVNRDKLRAALAEGLPITWNKMLSRYEETKEGQSVAAEFTDGTRVSGKYLIGADGSKSVVRKQKAPVLKVEDTPYTNIACLLPYPEEAAFPILHKYNQKYLTRVCGPKGSTILFFKLPHAPGEEQKLLMALSGPFPISKWDEYVQHFKEAYATCDELTRLLNSIIEEHICVDVIRLRKMSMPAENPFLPVDRVFLLGDAAHTMTTHRGLGANTAFRDAKELADALSQDRLSKYTDGLFRRGASAIKQSYDSTESIHSLDDAKRKTFLKGLGYVMGAFNFFSDRFS